MMYRKSGGSPPAIVGLKIFSSKMGLLYFEEACANMAPKP